jgi:hypothetical protein
MPYLSPELLSNYYFITMGGKRYLLDSWTEITQQDVNDISMIQGDIGNRVIDINNPFHQVTMNGPLVILRDLDNQLSNTAKTEIAPANVNDISDSGIDLTRGLSPLPITHRTAHRSKHIKY